MRIIAFAILLSLAACTSPAGRSVAIRDFSPSLQPYLRDAVATGVVGYDTATRYIRGHASDDELERLSRSEIPLLRAVALEEMLHRPKFDHFTVIMKHLDDTAIVIMDAGEWGFWMRAVSDHMIGEAHWRTEADKHKTLDEVILHHNYLRSAYIGLRGADPQARHYLSIREMVLRDRPMEEKEYALYALASYRKKEDIPLIREQLLQSHTWHVTETSFALMKDFPDTAYMEVLKEWYPRRFYRNICRNNVSSWGTVYIQALASYRSDSSAVILDSILNRKPFLPCALNSADVRSQLVRAIWANPCPAYVRLRRQIAEEMRVLLRQDSVDRTMTLSIDNSDIQEYRDTTSEPVRW